jgi:hypothetical protein
MKIIAMLIIAAIFIYRQGFLVFKSFLCLFEQGFPIQFRNDFHYLLDKASLSNHMCLKNIV